MDLLSPLYFFFMLWVIPIVILFLILSPFLLFALIVKKFKIKRFIVSQDVKDINQISRRLKDVVEEEIKRKSFKG